MCSLLAALSLPCYALQPCGAGLLSSCGVWAAHGAGFSCRRARAPGCRDFICCLSALGPQTADSVVVAHRPSCCRRDLPRPGIKAVYPHCRRDLPRPGINPCARTVGGVFPGQGSNPCACTVGGVFPGQRSTHVPAPQAGSSQARDQLMCPHRRWGLPRPGIKPMCLHRRRDLPRPRIKPMCLYRRRDLNCWTTTGFPLPES